MTHSLKTLGLAFVAILALSAVAASSASAEYRFTSSATNTDLTGEQTGIHKFTVVGQSVECQKATFTGTQTKAETNEVTITPAYAECKYGEKPAHVTMNGCHYLFTGATNSNHGRVHLECPTTASPHKQHVVEIHVTEFSGASECTMTIPTQTDIAGGTTYTNNGLDVIVHATASSIDVDSHGPGLACAAIGAATGTYTGTATLRGYTHNSAHGAGDQIDIGVHEIT